MEKKPLHHGSKLKICYLIERDRHPELHYFLKKLKKNDLSTFKKAVSFIERLKDNPQDFKTLRKFKKLKHDADLWELKISKETRFFLFYSAENEICITHGYRKQRKNDKRLKQEIGKAATTKHRYYYEQE
jgi:mRNA-degrading endonuclease RelE of RelBE toxin-antitoxin system